MAASKSVSNNAIYDRMDSVRLELKQDIISAVASVAQNQGRLEAKFDTLEAGRLTRSEQKITDLEIKLQKFEGVTSTKDAVISTRVATLWAIGGAIVIIGSEVLLNVLTRTK